MEFTDKEEAIFNQLVECLSKSLCVTPIALRQGNMGLNIDHFTRTVTDTKGNKILLTAKEFDLLYFLSSHKGQVFTKEQIYETVFGLEGDSDNSTISTHIKNIRSKLNKLDIQPIATVWGIGYKWE